MSVRIVVRKDSYQDSVFLMRISRDLKAVAGVSDAIVAMATPHNKTLLRDSGYASAALDAAGPNDLVIAARYEDGKDGDVDRAIERLLSPAGAEGGDAGGSGRGRVGADETSVRPRTLASALRTAPDSNLVLISVPGEYAAREARRALARGLHVMLFSDNVSIEDEIDLKREAVRRGLLMMGPDCGTAILNGMPLAFANAVRRGATGVVGASGTGIQEITSVIHRLGGGISQAIGTGGRDLSDRVGGLMTLQGIAALADDPATRVIVVVSKPPSPAVAEKVIAALRRTGKPAVVHFVGRHAFDATADAKAGAKAGAKTDAKTGAGAGIVFADSLAGAAEEACRLSGIPVPKSLGLSGIVARAEDLASRLLGSFSTARLCGLFCGGTTGQEALSLLERQSISVYSNLHKSGPRRVDGTAPVDGDVVLDLGADEFTVGRPHPMIEPILRNERLAAAMKDSAVAILLFDLILGYGSHENPAGVLAEGVERARWIARERPADCPREIVAVASVTGTDLDPQKLDAQTRLLERANITVMPDNRGAVALVIELIRRIRA